MVVGIVVTALLSLVSDGYQVGSAQPTASCVFDEQESRGTLGQPVEASGTSRIPFRIVVRGNDLDDLRTVGAAGETTVRIVVRPTASLSEEVAHRLTITGSGQTITSRSLMGVLEIPVSQTEPVHAIEEYLQYVEERALKAEPREQEVINKLQASRQTIVAALEKICVQNRPGVYRLECSYGSNREGTWRDSATGIVNLRIMDTGRFFDQVQFKQ